MSRLCTGGFDSNKIIGPGRVQLSIAFAHHPTGRALSMGWHACLSDWAGERLTLMCLTDDAVLHMLPRHFDIIVLRHAPSGFEG